jgi:zinc transporter ZupT
MLVDDINITMSIYLVTAITFIVILSGGFFSIRFRDKMNLILGLSAGLLFGLVAIELLPEIFTLSQETGTDVIYPMIALSIGFLLFHITEKTFLVHDSHEETYQKHHHPSVGIISAVALIVHSFLDGVGMGVGFQISASLGMAVAIAVMVHAFSDGLNTGSIMLLNNNSVKKTSSMVFLNALAPVLGVASTLVFDFSAEFLLMYLGFFAGIILYISLEDILPEAHSRDSSWKTVFFTVLGVVVIYLVTVLE